MGAKLETFLLLSGLGAEGVNRDNDNDKPAYSGTT
jgi:hypothetical protein